MEPHSHPELVSRIEVLERQYKEVVHLSTSILAEVRSIRNDLMEKYDSFSEELSRVNDVVVKTLELSMVKARKACKPRKNKNK